MPKMDAKEFAKIIDGVEFDRELTPDEERIAEENDLVVVYGTAYIFMEFRGAISGYIDISKDGSVLIDEKGLLCGPECEREDDCCHPCPYYENRKKKANKIEAAWQNDEDGAAWSYNTDIPHETFRMMDDGKLWCKGIVFNMEDVGREEKNEQQDLMEQISHLTEELDYWKRAYKSIGDFLMHENARARRYEDEIANMKENAKDRWWNRGQADG